MEQLKKIIKNQSEDRALNRDQHRALPTDLKEVRRQLGWNLIEMQRKGTFHN